MPLDPQHLSRAEHNERFLGTFDLDSTPYMDWAVTVSFYVAVRYVDALLNALRPPRRAESHEERNREVSTQPRLKPIWHSYRELYNQSRDARYGFVTFTSSEVRRLQSNRLNHVKTHIIRQGQQI